MKNVTILLAVLAMVAVTAQADLVDEDFNDAPVGWSYAGSAQDQPATPAGGFGYDDGNDAVTGTWERTDPIVTSRYYTGIDALNQDSTFSFSFDGTITDSTDEGTPVIVGLLNTGSNNTTNAFHVMIFGRADGGSGKEWAVLVGYCDDSGSATMEWLVDYNAIGTGVTYSCEMSYTGDGNAAVSITYTADGGTETTESDTFTGWNGTWEANAFGTSNWDAGSSEGTTTGSVDNLNLVPEPATMVLLGIGGIGVLIRRKRHV